MIKLKDVSIAYHMVGEAQRFIDFNGSDLPFGGDRLRLYYCPACCGWHISHLEHKADYEGRTDRLIKEYQKKKEWSKKKR
jgi:hypothetical protein